MARGEKMIELFTWPTPNGQKIQIMLEETDLAYEVKSVDIGAGEQFDPKFLKISPNNRIPAIVDPEGPDGQAISLFESGAILIYLAEKTGTLLSKDPRVRCKTLEWLMFQMGNVGPMLGQAHHFRVYAPARIDYAITRYTKEANRLYAVLDRRLGESPYLAGSDYSIADIAVFPWLRSYERQGVDLGEYPAVSRWFDEVSARPAVKRGLQILAERRRKGPIGAAEREVLFGSRQYQRR